MAVGAGYSATSANEYAGAKSKKSAWVAALAVVIFLLFFRQYIANIPEPVLASIVRYAVSGHLRFAPHLNSILFGIKIGCCRLLRFGQ